MNQPLTIGLFLLLLGLALPQLKAQKQSAPNYIITTQNDTLVVRKITYVDTRWSDLKFTLTMPNGSKQQLNGSTVWRYKETRNGKVRFYQVARIQGKKRINHMVMRLLSTGRLTLMFDRRGDGTDLFVTGEGWNDMVTSLMNFKKLKAHLDQCKAFKATYQSKQSRRFGNVVEMVQFYNRFCGPMKLEAKELDHKELPYCVPLALNETNRIFWSQEELEAAVRNDASRETCLEQLPDIDWEKYILVGNNISSGACGRPVGLGYLYNVNIVTGELHLDIFYNKDQPLCRALSKYSHWLLLTRPHPNTPINTRIRAVDPPE